MRKLVRFSAEGVGGKTAQKIEPTGQLKTKMSWFFCGPLWFFPRDLSHFYRHRYPVILQDCHALARPQHHYFSFQSLFFLPISAQEGPGGLSSHPQHDVSTLCQGRPNASDCIYRPHDGKERIQYRTFLVPLPQNPC